MAHEKTFCVDHIAFLYAAHHHLGAEIGPDLVMVMGTINARARARRERGRRTDAVRGVYRDGAAREKIYNIKPTIIQPEQPKTN